MFVCSMAGATQTRLFGLPVSARSAKRRIASGLDTDSSCCFIHASNLLRKGWCKRTISPSPRPVVFGLPGPRLFGISRIDFAIN
jgi:hypothetical protein